MNKPDSPNPKRVADWERIEVDYRAGVKTLREIAAEHGLAHGAINKRAKRDGWDRDLSAKVRAKAEALVSRAEVSSRVSVETEREVVQAQAQQQAAIRLEQRADIRKAREAVSRLWGELEQTTDSGGDVDNLAKRTAIAHKLMEAQTKLFDLQVRAFNLEDRYTQDQDDPILQMTDAERVARIQAILSKARARAAEQQQGAHAVH